MRHSSTLASILALAALLGAGARSGGALPGQARTALVIGNASYAGTPLRNPLHDARDMASLLSELGFEVDLLLDAGHQEMEEAARDFGRELRRRGGVGVFYYAGHGAQSQGRNYLIPIGAKIEDETELKFKTMDAEFVLAHMGEAVTAGRVNLVILDACRDNPYRQLRSLSRGLAPAQAGAGTLIAYATAPGKVADDGGAGERNGRFTKHLLRFLRQPGLEIGEVIRQTRAAVVEETAGGQVPWSTDSLIGRFVPVPAAPDTAPARAGELRVDEATGARLRYIPAGTFQMGSPASEPGRYDDETRHPVTLTRPYWMMETEVTQGQWEALMGQNPSHFSGCGARCPVERVSWYDAIAFANELSEQAGLETCYEANCSGEAGTWKFRCAEVTFRGPDCRGYRLPTEAEWERAARAGATSALYTGGLTLAGEHHGPELDAIAWYGGNSGVEYTSGWDCERWPEKQKASRHCGTHPVGEKQPNAWELRDMLGNVWEWVWDAWEGYPTATVTDPRSSAEGSNRVLRGGGWSNQPRDCRAALRNNYAPDQRYANLGFRLVRTAP